MASSTEGWRYARPGSLFIYYLAIARRLPTEKVDKYMEDVYPPPVVEH